MSPFGDGGDVRPEGEALTPPTGRDARGRFAPGNPGGPGNPHGGKVARLRAALLDAVTDDDLDAVARVLVQKARSGELAAIRELLDRVLGRVVAMPDADPSGAEATIVRFVFEEMGGPE